MEFNVSTKFQTNKTSTEFEAAISYKFSYSGGFFQSTIELHNITYAFVGYYQCVKKAWASFQTSEKKSRHYNQISRIYLFVEGNLLKLEQHIGY